MRTLETSGCNMFQYIRNYQYIIDLNLNLSLVAVLKLHTKLNSFY